MLKIPFYLLIFFLIIDLYFLINAVISQIFYSTAELLVPIEIPSSEAEGEIEKVSVIA